MRKEELYSGQLYKHFKGNLYQIITTAVHTETEEKLVVYQALYGEYQIFARPYSMFLEEVDHNKYPNASQKYRFERFFAEEQREKKVELILNEPADPPVEEATVTEQLMQFLDADTCQEKWIILQEMEESLNEHILNSIMVSLDLVITEESMEERLDEVKAYLRTRIRFEDRRMR